MFVLRLLENCNPRVCWRFNKKSFRELFLQLASMIDERISSKLTDRIYRNRRLSGGKEELWQGREICRWSCWGRSVCWKERSCLNVNDRQRHSEIKLSLDSFSDRRLKCFPRLWHNGDCRNYAKLFPIKITRTNYPMILKRITLREFNYS